MTLNDDIALRLTEHAAIETVNWIVLFLLCCVFLFIIPLLMSL